MRAEPVTPTAQPTHPVSAVRGGRAIGRIAVLAAGILLLAGGFVASLLLGAGGLAPGEVWSVIVHDDRSQTAVIVWDMRLTRTLTALLAGAALAVAGMLMQTIVRNPLADPGLLGVNAGAGLAVVVAVGGFGATGFFGYIGFALAGAIVVSMIVYAIGVSARRDAPATLVLAGTAITAVLFGVATGLALIDPARFNAMRGWMAGSVAGRDLEEIGWAGVLIAAGILLVIVFVRPIGQLALGDDIARALGVRVGRTRVVAGIAVMLLAGTATAIAGPIVFIGLMVPHLVRALVGHRGGWGTTYAAGAGALLLLVADILGRLVLAPGEAPAGLITAIIGAPALAALVRGRRGMP